MLIKEIAVTLYSIRYIKKQAGTIQEQTVGRKYREVIINFTNNDTLVNSDHMMNSSVSGSL